MRTLGWRKHKLKSRLPGEISITSDMQMTPPYGRKWRGTKEPPDENERGGEKVGLKLNIQKARIMVSGPITHGKYMGKQWKQCQTLFWGGSKITADGDCSREIKRRLLLGRKAMTNLDNILKSRDIILPTKVYSQSYDFSSSHVWMWELDYKGSWVQKNWCFCTVVLEKTVESP